MVLHVIATGVPLRRFMTEELGRVVLGCARMTTDRTTDSRFQVAKTQLQQPARTRLKIDKSEI